MADIPINQAMDSMGASVSAQDFVQALIASITGSVGKPEPYSKEKTAEQKKAEEQLKKMDKLTEGLEDLTKQLQEIKKIADQAKKKVSNTKGSNFDNLGAAMGKLHGGGKQERDNTNLEQNVFRKLARMADEAVTGHSLHVEDFHVARKLDTIIGQMDSLISRLGAKEKVPELKNNKKTPTDSSLGHREVGNGNEVGSMPESNSAASMAQTNHFLEQNKALMDSLEKKAGKWAAKLGLTKEEIVKILHETAELSKYNTEDLLALEKGLDNYGKMEKFDRRRLDSLLREIKLLKARNEENAGSVSQEEMAQSRQAFGAGAVNAGHRMNLAPMLDTAQRAFGLINKILDVANTPAKTMGMPDFQVGPQKAMTETNEAIKNVGQGVNRLNQGMGNVMDQTNNWASEMRDTFLNMRTSIGSIEGEATENLNKIANRTLGRGIRDARTIQSLTKTSVSLGRQIGADTAQTADELQDWVQRFSMSNTQARLLSQSIQRVQSMTGLTGDNLLNAVKNAQTLAEQMKNTGNFTAENNETLIRFSASAQKLGTTQFTAPLMTALGDRNTFLNTMNEGQRQLLLAFGRSAPNRGAAESGLIKGTTLDTPGAGMNLVKGGQEFLRQMIQQRFGSQYENVEQLRQGPGGAERVQQLNLLIRALTNNEYGLGQLERVIETMRDTFETEQDKIDRLNTSLKNNANMTDDQRKAIENQIAQTKTTQSMNSLSKITSAMGGGQTLAQGMNATGMTKADIEKDIRAMAGRAGMGNADDLVARATGPGATGKDFNTVIEEITKSLEDKQAKEREQADPVTRELMINNKRQAEVDNFYAKQWAELLKRLPEGSIAHLNELAGWSTGLTSLIEKLGLLGFALGSGKGMNVLMGVAAITALATGFLTVWSDWDKAKTEEKKKQIAADADKSVLKIREDTEKTASDIKDPELAEMQRQIGKSREDQVLLASQGIQFDEHKNSFAVKSKVASEKLFGGRSATDDSNNQYSADLQQKMLKMKAEEQDLIEKMKATAAQKGTTLPRPPEGGWKPLNNTDNKPPPSAVNTGGNIGKGNWTGRNSISPQQAIIDENRRREIEGRTDLLPTTPPSDEGHVELHEPGVLENAGNRMKTGLKRIWSWMPGYAEGTREIQRTGLGLLHQGEMVVPKEIARHLNAEGNGPFQDALAWSRPGGGGGSHINSGGAVDSGRVVLMPTGLVYVEAKEVELRANGAKFDAEVNSPDVKAKVASERIMGMGKSAERDRQDQMMAAARERMDQLKASEQDLQKKIADLAQKKGANDVRPPTQGVKPFNNTDNPPPTPPPTPPPAPVSSGNNIREQVHNTTIDRIRDENLRRQAAGRADLLPEDPDKVKEVEPGLMENWGNRLKTGFDRINPFAEGTREIQRTGLGLLHQGEMVVPREIARHLNAEGNGPFQDALAMMRPGGSGGSHINSGGAVDSGRVVLMPTGLVYVEAKEVEISTGNNDAMMKHRMETEFVNADVESTVGKANQTLDEISEYNRQQVELIKQEIEVLKSILARLTSSPPSGVGPGDTSPNSKGAPPPNYYAYSIRALNSTNFSGTENFTRG